jgi:hypothetical protein
MLSCLIVILIVTSNVGEFQALDNKCCENAWNILISDEDCLEVGTTPPYLNLDCNPHYQLEPDDFEGGFHIADNGSLFLNRMNWLVPFGT